MLFQKMLRDIKLFKVQFISVFLLSFISVFIYSGISSEWYGLQQNAERFYKETGFADAWAMGRNITNEHVKKVKEIDGISETERRLTIEAVAELEDTPSLTLHFPEQGNISTSLLIEGEEFNTGEDGIWLDSSFAEAWELKVGDTINVSAFGRTLSKTIRGTVINPEYIYAPPKNEILPDHKKNGFGILSPLAWPKDLPILYTELLISTEMEINDALVEDIESVLEGEFNVLLTRKQNKSHEMLYNEISEHRTMGRIFPIAFLTVAMLTILTTMIRLVNYQRTQIGVLKALGFSKRKILIHYISYGFWLSLLGSILGALIGPITLPYLFLGPMKMIFVLPEWGVSMTSSTILMVTACVVGCTLAAFLACYNNLQDTPAKSLRPKPPRASRRMVFDRLWLWRRLSFNTQWNMRDAFRSKVRSIMGIVGVVGCTALMICAFGLDDSLEESSRWNFQDINHYESELVLSETITDEQIAYLLKQYKGEALRREAIEVKANDIKQTAELQVEDQVTMIQSYDPNLKPVSLPEKGLTISYQLAKDLKIKEGDEIGWHIYGEERWHTSTVEFINRKPLSQGITLSKASYEELGYTFRPTVIISSDNLTKETDLQYTMVTKEAELGKVGVTMVWSKKDQIKSFDSMTEAMKILIYVLILAAVVLGVVVLYNLGVLSFTERHRELSTLKVIGFGTKKIRTLLLTQNIWMTVLGILIGIPSGLWLLNYIFIYMGQATGFITKVYGTSYIYSIIGTLLVSISVNRLFSRKVRNLDMVGSLKGVE